ncbi:MAG TPA: transketolase C-terminal domain-containing protein [Candidatus Eisenbacteria bacterium]|nr:transketolase C-terminal domain-containing protein [Candidatus Eisenbacteria bacterium]
MRVEFAAALKETLNADPSAMFLTGDLGYNAFEELQKTYGKRFLNAGVAEQNMVGVAAGLALTGMRPWVYSITPFLTFRAFEQIRIDVCFHNLPVRLVGNGGGYTYGIMGSTHHALEDLGVLKGLPNLSLFFPCAGDQVQAAVHAMAALEGPAYLRLAISAFAKAGRKPLSENPRTLTRRYRKGGAVTVIGVGHAVEIALAAMESSPSTDADVFGVARFPFDPAADAELWESARRTGRVVLVDEHYLAGGVAESLAAALPALSRTILAARYRKDQLYGTSRFHLEQSGLTPEAVLNACQTKG